MDKSSCIKKLFDTEVLTQVCNIFKRAENINLTLFDFEFEDIVSVREKDKEKYLGLFILNPLDVGWNNSDVFTVSAEMVILKQIFGSKVISLEINVLPHSDLNQIYLNVTVVAILAKERFENVHCSSIVYPQAYAI